MIEVKDLRFCYPRGSEEAVKGISFTVSPGEIYGFLGPSGAGKSTTQKILLGLFRNYRGSARIMGRESSRFKKEDRLNFGASFEAPNFYNRLSGLDNLKFFGGLYPRTGNIRSLMERVGLGPAMDKKVENYSKGMKMRLNFVRSILHDPGVLFLDEPTSGLDPNNGEIIMDLIREESHKGKVIFLTTHNMEVADQLCHRVSFMVDGKIILTDSPEKLKLQYGSPEVLVEPREDHIDPGRFPLEGLGDNKDFKAFIKTYSIKRIHSQEATLEDIFRITTGRRLV